MAILYVNTGSSPNKGDGDSLRTSFNKINQNFAYLASNTATTATIGMVKVGNNLSISPDGTLNAANGNYVLPTASTSTLGGVKVDGITILINDGVISATTSTNGAANTGDITFDGVKVIGAGTASGDGNGYSTLELVPDANLTATNQYLVIDPTFPSHIHIRAGGPQDSSTAELFLGGEINHVRVIDNGGVRLSQGVFNTNFTNFEQNLNYDTAVWFTDESGNHWIDVNITDPMAPTRDPDPQSTLSYNFPQYPQNRIEVYDGTGYYDVSPAGQTYTLGNPYQIRLDVAEAPPVSPTFLVDMTYKLATLTQSGLLLEDNDFDLYVPNNAYMYADQTIQLTTGVGNIRITADDNNSSPTWYFTAQGYMQFPQGLGPTTSKGKEGDEAGSVVFDGSYIYYCHTDYTDGVADIWKRVQWSNDTW